MSEIVDCIAWIVRKTCWSLAVFFRFIVYRLLDLLGLIFNILACATLVRLPAMILQFQEMDDLWEWRFLGLVQFIIFLVDIPIFVMGIILILTLWRIYPCFTELRDEWDGKFKRHGIYYTGANIRLIIAKHFFTLFIDVVCVPTGLICLLSWRCKIFIRRMQDARSDWKRRKYCFVEFLHLLLDIPLILCFVISMLSWRLPFVLRHIKKDKAKNRTWTDDIRYRGIQHLFYLFLDLPCIIMFLLSCMTWRLPFVLRRVKQRTEIWKKRTQKKIRVEVCLEFVSIFMDIPCMIISVIITLTIWRMYFFVTKLKKVLRNCRDRKLNRDDEMEIRIICLQQFGYLFVDLLSFILFLIVLVTLWRLYPLIVEVKKYLKQFQNWQKEQKHFENKSINIGGSNEELSTRENNDSNNENGSNETQLKTCNLSTCMWKIRKAIAINFAMIFVDVPAIILFIFLLITLLRASKTISAVIGSGNFYLLFAITVYHQTAMFFVDLLYFLLFLVLIIWRPIAVWVHLFEDEEHMKFRILTDEIIPWGKVTVDMRNVCVKEMDDAIAIAIKERTSYQITRNNLEHIFLKGYFKKLSKLSDMLDEKQIQDEYVNILNAIKFYESNRVTKLMRKYLIESVYLQRPDTRIHASNLSKYREEIRIYESKLKDLYGQLTTYKAEHVPLYDEKCGLVIRSSGETKKVLIKCLTQGYFVFVVSFCLACIPLYRAPRMFLSIRRKWIARLDVVKETLLEYCLDSLAFIQMLFVLLLIYRAPFMIADIVDCMIERRSVKAVRNVIEAYPPKISDDFVSLFSFIFSWNTPRLFFTTILFAVLMPADLFLSVIRIRYNDKCKAYFFTFLMYAFFVGSPLVIVYYASGKLVDAGNGWMNIILLSVFYFCLFTVLIALVLTVAKCEEKKFLFEVPKADYIRYTWYNIHIFIFELLEFIQGIALIFKLRDIPMYGGSSLHTASEYVLFSFFSFKTVFWITVAFLCVWFFICGAPIILENVLETLPLETCSKRSSWRLAVSLFANTLFLTMIESFMSMSSCYYYSCPEMSHALVAISNSSLNNNTCVLTELVDDRSIECWTNQHIPYSLFGFLGVVWYASTAMIFVTNYGDPNTFEQDVGFSPAYNTVINVLKGFMVLSTTIITEQKYVSISLFMLFNLVAIIYTFCFRAIYKYQPCNLLSVLVWRIYSFIAAVLAAVAVLTAFLMNDSSSKVPLIILCVGIVIFFIIAVIFTKKLQQESEIIKHRNSFRKNILLLEAKVSKNKWFIDSWNKQSITWKRLAKTVREVSKVERNYNTENWNIDKIFEQAQTQDTDFEEYVKPPPLPPSDSSHAYEPPPVGSSNPSHAYEPPPVGSSDSSHAYESPRVQSSDSTQPIIEPPSIEPIVPMGALNNNAIPTDKDQYDMQDISQVKNSAVESSKEKPVLLDEDTKNTIALGISKDEDSDYGNFAVTKNDFKVNDTFNAEGESQPNTSTTENSKLFEKQISYDSLNPVKKEETLNSEESGFIQNNVEMELLVDMVGVNFNVIELEKNGRNLLLILEKHIRYDAFRYSFLSQRNHWLNAVWESNWQSLAHCLQVLESNLLGTYDKPSQMDIRLSPPSLPTDQMIDDPHDKMDLPPKVKKLTKEEKIELSNSLRCQIIEAAKSLTNHGNELSKIFEIILPELPVISLWRCNDNEFELHCRRPATGVITEIGEGGNKLAKGASFTIGRQLKGYISDDGLTFEEGKSVSGKKGPVSAVVKDLLFVTKGGALYLSVNGKKVNYDIAMGSCKTIKWS